MTPLPFNGPLFAHDFILALDRAEKASHRGRPHFNEKRWFRCLAQAAERDDARRLTDHYAKNDAKDDHHVHVHYFERLYASCTPKMNGHPLRVCASEPEIRFLHQIRAAEAAR